MLKVEYLISSFRKYIALLFTFLVLSSCSIGYLSGDDLNSFYVAPISELEGMYIRNNLLVYFPNQDENTALYKINVSTSRNKSLYLLGKSGFASKGRITMDVRWNLVRIKDNNTLINVLNTFIESYNIEPSGYSIRVNEDEAIKSLADRISRDIKLKIYGFMSRRNKEINDENLSNSERISTNPTS